MIDNIKYSLVVSYSLDFKHEYADDIKELLIKGIKVIVILNKYINIEAVREELKSRLENIEEFERHKFLQIYNIDKELNKDLYIVDGNRISEIEEIYKYIKGFNYEQYKAEHFGIDKNILIEASAGTGKTTVMIDRILYLLHMDNSLNFDNITMITFTNDATKNMKQKLSDKILQKYELTKNMKYLNYIDKVGDIQIKTIHSFSKQLIGMLGTIVGYGKNVKLRGFKYEKDEIILDTLNNYFKEGTLSINQNIKTTLKMSLTDFIKMINAFWSEMEKKGISSSEVNEIDWGISHNVDSEDVHNIITQIFKDIEKIYKEMKIKENSIDVSGITRELDNILSTELTVIDRNSVNIKYKLNNIKYLFIDEFQDSDDIQIKLIHWLYKNLDIKIFAVGDIKQSIYRFRGTNDTAFDEIRNKIIDIENISLVKNYRTSENIINELNALFKSWSRHNLISYENRSVIEPMNENLGQYYIVKNKENHIKRLVSCFNYYRDNFDENNKTESNKIVVLVRNNDQVKYIKNICEQNNIQCSIQAGGTFFTCDAVRDFKDMISAYLYYEEPKYKMNLVESSFLKVEEFIDYKELYSKNGDKNELNRSIDSLLENHSNYYKYKDEFRIKPVIQVIIDMIKNEAVVNNYYNKIRYKLRNKNNCDNDNIAKDKTKIYERNLNKLLEMINEKFEGDYCSLYKLHEYLLINIKTNRDEDEESLEDEETFGYIHCMTAHKSKGLEFETVILPFLNNPFIKNINPEILLYKENDKYEAGWRNGLYKNNYYDKLKYTENNKVIKEETRILYVALTRAISNLVCIQQGSFSNSNIKNPNSWSHLL